MFTQAGTYKLAYVIYQRTFCTYPEKTFTNNQTTPVVKFGSSFSSSKDRMIASVDASSAYSGDDITKTAKYIA